MIERFLHFPILTEEILKNQLEEPVDVFCLDTERLKSTLQIRDPFKLFELKCYQEEKGV